MTRPRHLTPSPPDPPAAAVDAQARRGTDTARVDQVTARTARHLLSQATLAAYDSDWTRFTSWAAASNVTPLPAHPDDVAVYLDDAAHTLTPDGQPRYRIGTLRRWVAAINRVHTTTGHAPPGAAPQVRDTLRALANQFGTPPRRKQPLLTEDIQAILEAMDTRRWPANLASARDTAVILLAFAGAFRRDELASVTLEAIDHRPGRGAVILLPRSKTDQRGGGLTKAILAGEQVATCALCALCRWGRIATTYDTHSVIDANAATIGFLRVHGPDSGEHWHEWTRPARPRSPFLRPVTQGGRVRPGPMSGRAVSEVIKRRAAAVGMDPSRISGHSARAGFVTQAINNRVPAAQILLQTGHTSEAGLAPYYRGDPFRDSASAHLGL